MGIQNFDPPPGPELLPEASVGSPARTRVVVVSSQKGGSGKTTLCGHLAVEAERTGAGPVAVIDTDPQGSLSAWWNARQDEAPAFMTASLDHLKQSLELLSRGGVRWVFVDTPPAVTDMIREIVGHADLVVIPTRPSPHDLRAVGVTIDIVDALKKQMVFVVNDATKRARITAEVAVALSQHGTVAPVTVHHRVDFATSMIDGRTVMEISPDSRSANEIAELWTYLRNRFQDSRASAADTARVLTLPRSSGFGKRQSSVAVAGAQ